MIGSRKNRSKAGLKSCPWGCCERYSHNKKQARRAIRHIEKRKFLSDVRDSI